MNEYKFINLREKPELTKTFHWQDYNYEEEKEYLEKYDINNFMRPSVAADIVTFAVMQEGEHNDIRKLANRELKLLLIKRGQYPYKGAWALPGGFAVPGESVEETAKRELFEETGVKNPILHLGGVYADEGRDPRGWIISNCYISLVNEADCRLRADTDAWDAAWFKINLCSEEKKKDGISVQIKHSLTLTFDSDLSLNNIGKKEFVQINASVIEEKTLQGNHYNSEFIIDENDGLAFDHAKIIVKSLLDVREMVDYDFRIAFDLLPESFTLTQLQSTIEKIKNQKLLSPNFRRKIADYVEETGEVIEGQGHRPAKLFRIKRN